MLVKTDTKGRRTRKIKENPNIRWKPEPENTFQIFSPKLRRKIQHKRTRNFKTPKQTIKIIEEYNTMKNIEYI